MSLSAAVAAQPLLAGKVEKGLQALGAHSACVECDQSRRLGESLNLEAALMPSLRGANHWDYAVSWSPRGTPRLTAACFIEVHPANNNHVSHLIAKRAFIFAWLAANAQPVLVLAQNGAAAFKAAGCASGHVFHWVATGASVAFSARSKEGRLLAQAGISGPKRRLVLP